MHDKIVGWFIKIYKQGESCYLDDEEMIKREGAYPQSIRARKCFYSKQEAISFIGRCFRKVEDYNIFYGIEPYYYTDYRKDWGIPG